MKKCRVVLSILPILPTLNQKQIYYWLVNTFHLKGKKVYSGTVKFQVGSKSKSLNIYGNRYWTVDFHQTLFSNPEAFSEMEIRYENSFGGKDYKKNPVGKGIDKTENKSGEKINPLPNIINPGANSVTRY